MFNATFSIWIAVPYTGVGAKADKLDEQPILMGFKQLFLLFFKTQQKQKDKNRVMLPTLQPKQQIQV